MSKLPGRHRLALILLGATLTPSNSIQAQAVSGRVAASESGSPLAGAFVRLLDDSGRQRSAVLTNALGWYQLRAPGPGFYRVRAEFIGREVTEMGLVELREDLSVEWSPALAPKPVELEGLEVEGTRRCAIPSEEGSLVASVWAEARKALEVAAWAADQELYSYELLSHRRELDGDTRVVLEERSERKSGLWREPFVSKPAEDLMLKGFVQETPEGAFAYAPDARVLLSDAFLREYCFRLGEGERGQLGLAFEPTRERKVPDIQGTMWLDRETTELRSVMFRYRRFPGVGNSPALGGHLDFERLPTGAWIIRRWAVEMPLWADVLRPGTIDIWDRRLVGLMEEGAEVLRVVGQEGSVVLVADRATLHGAVFDSIRGRPLAGTVVKLSGTGYGGMSGTDGTFHLADLPGGRYFLEISHPRLDSLGIHVGPVQVELVSSQTTRVTVAIPRSVAADSEGELRVRGEVLEASDGTAIEGAEVELVDDSGSSRGTVLTDDVGAFEVFAPEPGIYRVSVAVRGREPASSDPFEVRAQHAVFHSFLYDGPPVRVAQSPGAGVTTVPRADREWDGVTILGTVEARESGAPLPDVLVRIADLPPVPSDARGRFSLSRVPLGRHHIEVEFLGRAPLLDTLVLEEAGIAAVRVVLAEAPIELDPLVVEVEPRSIGLEAAGFYDRRDKSGISGWRITREGIEKHPTARVSDLLNNVPSTFLMYPGSPPGAMILRMNRLGNRFLALQRPASALPGCEPRIYVDGLDYRDQMPRTPSETRVRDLNFISPTAIEGIEVYTGLTAPARFDANGCGVILIWTRGYR
jgi:hypothetical protein